ncbi:unnamed protein product [Closterium sp. Yama58-4]|nr:unnamed protein product [Closterium sp. Yama58-4]
MAVAEEEGEEVNARVVSSVLQKLGIERRVGAALALFHWLQRVSGSETVRSGTTKTGTPDFEQTATNSPAEEQAVCENEEARKGETGVRWKGLSEPNVYTYNSLLGALKASGEWARMEEVVEWMSANGVAPDAVTLNTLLSALETQGKDEAAWDLLTKFGIQYSFHKPRRPADAQNRPGESKPSESKKHEPNPHSTLDDAATVPQHLVAASAPTKAADSLEKWSVRPDLFTVRTVLPVCRRGRVVERALALYSLALESAGSASGSSTGTSGGGGSSSSSSTSSRGEGSSGTVAREGERGGSTRQQQQHREVAAALRFACNEEMKQIVAALERQVDGNRQADGNWQPDVHVQAGKAEQTRTGKAAALAQDTSQGGAGRAATGTKGVAVATVAGAASSVGEREGGAARSQIAAADAAVTVIGAAAVGAKAAAVGAKAAAAETSRRESSVGMDEEELEEQEELEGEEGEEGEEQERGQGQRAGSLGPGEGMMRHGRAAARKRGLWRWALSLLSKMESAGLPPDAFAWRTVLVTCAKANETASAIKVFEDMVETGVRADAVAYGALLSALEKGDLLEPAEAVWGHMRKMGEELVAVRVHSRQAGTPARAAAYREHRLGADVAAFNAMVTACAHAGEGLRALDWLQKMEVSSATPPNATTYQQAAIALADASHWEAALSLIPRARSRGIEPTPLMFEVVQRACAANGADFASQLAVVSTSHAELVGGAKS